MNTPYKFFVGIDIAARTASVAFATSTTEVEPAFEITQSPRGFDKLIKRLEKLDYRPEEVLVIIEATGNYWLNLGHRLDQGGYAISVINPSSAYYYAKASLKRDKTDEIDAQTLAQLGTTIEPKLWTPPTDIRAQLKQLVQQRADLRDNRTQVLNRLHALRHNPQALISSIDRFTELANLLKKQINDIEAEILEILHREEDWCDNAWRMMSVKGIGLISATWMLVITNNFTECETPEELVSFIGFAPRQWQSGPVEGRRYIGFTGQAQLRRILYMSALNSTRHNPVIKTFYKRLKERGKPSKVAICACARKLIHICWAVATKKTLFDPNYQKNLQPEPVAT